MSDYTKSTDFASKDSLPSGDAAKIVKGTEIDTEFNNIAVAIATKADLASPGFSGSPTAPTQSTGDSSTKLATTAFVQAALSAMYPVGSIYTNAAVSTNPATLLGENAVFAMLLLLDQKCLFDPTLLIRQHNFI